MAKLFQALEGIGDGLEKVASGLGDGLQKVVDKTDSITTRLNRHVNPLSSHYGEHRVVPGHLRLASGGDLASPGQSMDAHRRLENGSLGHRYHSEGDLEDMPMDASEGGGGDLGASNAPSRQARTTWDHHQVTSSDDFPVRTSTDMSKGFSRAAFHVTQKILDAAEKEIQDLQREREEYSRTLAELRQLEAEQEASYVKAEAELRVREEKLQAELADMEKQSRGGLEVQM
mmetsp:Transcript_27693/g.69836  ORF Transcript_27693/g.69836 Transcript_27693/m.69836 type:complete len:230 (+) Transcript_27693:62-751(+)